jgi:hypothetical protein
VKRPLSPGQPAADEVRREVTEVIGVQMADEDLVQELVGDIEARDARRGARASVEEELVAIAQLEKPARSRL